MKRFDPAGAAPLRAIFSPLAVHLAIRSMIAGHTPAWAFADRPDIPTAALLWNRQDALYLAGENQDLAALAGLRYALHYQILPDARARQIPELALACTPVWEAMLPMLLDGLAPRRAQRVSFRWQPPSATQQPPELPAGFAIRPIDPELLNTPGLQADGARGWVESFWHSIEEFARHGFGYAVVAEEAHQVAAWCLAVYADEDEFELGVASDPAYRQRGLATLASSACLLHAQQRGLALHWHCWADHLASTAIARKMGFSQPCDYHVFRFSTQLSGA